MSVQLAMLAISYTSQAVEAISLDITSESSIKSAAATTAYEMMLYYGGNKSGGTPGILGGEYYWWEAGGMFGTLVEYWYYTGDTTYNAETKQALVFQAGTDGDYMPANQSLNEGNDDQSFWGMAAMTAAETNFTNPDSDDFQWLGLAQGVFNTMAARWDTSTCGGGLRWQIYTWNSGYTYKNSIANGALFNLGARLARYTSNSSYADWAVKIWDWETSVGLMSSSYDIYDGTSDTTNCSSIDHTQWSYNAGIWLFGAAMMYNYVCIPFLFSFTRLTNQTNGSSVWETRVNGILSAASIFFEDDIMYEQACQSSGDCDTDQLTFKAYFSRWLAATTKIAPFTYDTVMPYLQASAKAAAAQCTGGSSGIVCGSVWTNNTYDGTYGVGQQMSAMSAIQSLLITEAVELVTNSTGGTSVGNADQGTTSSSSSSSSSTTSTVVTTGDRVGAAFLTTGLLAGLLGAGWFMITE